MQEAVLIDTEEGIFHYRLCAVISALKIEIKTGMKMSRGSLVKLAQESYGITARNKAKALEQLLDYYLRRYGRSYGKGNA